MCILSYSWILASWCLRLDGVDDGSQVQTFFKWGWSWRGFSHENQRNKLMQHQESSCQTLLKSIELMFLLPEIHAFHYCHCRRYLKLQPVFLTSRALCLEGHGRGCQGAQVQTEGSGGPADKNRQSINRRDWKCPLCQGLEMEFLNGKIHGNIPRKSPWFPEGLHGFHWYNMGTTPHDHDTSWE